MQITGQGQGGVTQMGCQGTGLGPACWATLQHQGTLLVTLESERAVRKFVDECATSDIVIELAEQMLEQLYNDLCDGVDRADCHNKPKWMAAHRLIIRHRLSITRRTVFAF